ncbi:class I lanthipeptide [Taibaiella koreensis]|uniref:class I lanthipeptide n=1 Tax=Taibaiella koreensis TaxID=1268548 RepID=UPI000E59BB8F|nr:class I lanthipeptide [Taibaiella koreensis]
MKKKHLSTRLSLNKKTITTLSPGQSLQAMGGNDSRLNPSVCPCIPPTEPVGCSNGCPSIAIDWLSNCCATHVCIPATEPQGCSNGCPVTA